MFTRPKRPKTVPSLLILLSCFASASAASLPGIAPSDLTTNLAQFTWGQWKAVAGQADKRKCGSLRTSDAVVEICMFGDTAHVRRVEANVLGGGKDGAVNVFGFLGGMPIDDVNTDAVRAWLDASLPKSRAGKVISKSFGPAMYKVSGVVGGVIKMEIVAR